MIEFCCRFSVLLAIFMNSHTLHGCGYCLCFVDDIKGQADEIEYGYPITCGDSKAVLLFKKFVCPGINVRCVKVSRALL